MPRKIGNFIVIFALTAGAVLAGYEFLSIRMDLPFVQPKEENLEPRLTVETLPDEHIGQTEQAAVAVPGNEEKIVAHVVDYLKVNGSNVMDSRYFADQAACDSAVRTVAQEYKRRGIPEQDMAETAPFPDSRGAVVMFTNQGILHYVGCMSPMNENWAVYVQFVPNGRE